jgi:diketogulonate reductase-like aldo/keto reductase
LGLAIKESGVPRSELFVTTKAVGHEDVEGLLRSSLAKLGTEYIDLYLVHEPFQAGGSEEALQSVWQGMEACLEKGLARNIGVSNFLVPHLEAVMKTAKTKPAVNQVELHPYLPRQELVDFCQNNGILVEAYAPLTPLTKGRPGPIDDVAQRLAEKHGVSDSIVLLRWLLEKGIVAVTTSGRKERLEEYLKQVPSFSLSAQEVGEISRHGEQKKFRQFFSDLYGKDNWD